MTQQSPNPQPEDAVHGPKSRNRRARPFAIESRAIPGKCIVPRSNEWAEWNAYRTADERDRALEQLQRKYSFYEWRAVTKQSNIQEGENCGQGSRSDVVEEGFPRS